jgi:hypothetical protein
MRESVADGCIGHLIAADLAGRTGNNSFSRATKPSAVFGLRLQPFALM